MNCIQLKQGTTALVLQGSGAAAPVTRAVMKPASLPSSPALLPKGEGSWGNESGGVGSVYEAVLVTLEGTAASIESALQSLARWLVEAEKMARLSGEEPVYLEVQVVSGGTTWRSKVLGGELLLLGAGPDQRSVQRQGVELRLERVSYWENSVETGLYLSSAETARTTEEVTVYNDWAANKNYAQLLAADAGGDLPAPVRLKLSNKSGVNATVYAGQNLSLDPANLVPMLQGEDSAAGSGATVTDTAAATASGGYFARVTWSGSGTAVVKFGISSTRAGQLGNWAWLPVMRVHNPIASGELYWANWRVALTVGGNTDVLLEGRPGYLSNTAVLQPGSPLYLPVWKAESGDAAPSLDLELVLQAEASGSHTLDVDYVFLLPLERWRIYRATVNYAAGMYLQDDPYQGIIKSYTTVQGHQAEGPGLWVVPGKLQRYYFLLEGVSPLLPAQDLAVKMYYRARKRAL